MLKSICVALVALALLPAALLAQAKPDQPQEPKIKVGDTAPDFTLQYFDGSKLQNVSLHDYKGKKNVVLAFYIFAFTGG